MNSLEARKLLLGLKGICGLPELVLEGTGGGIPGNEDVCGAPQPSKSNGELGNRACGCSGADGKGSCAVGMDLP